MSHDSFEIFGDREHMGRLVVTCEHAANRVPPPLTTTESDRRWLETHWGWDIGAQELARELVRTKDCLLVLTAFSRLICDANRPPDHPNLIRTEIDGEPLSFNQNLDQAEVQRRLSLYYEPYHAAIDRCLGERLSRGGDVVLLSIHSFTPHFRDEVRDMEIGVLFDDFEAVAARLAGNFEKAGFVTALNAPYSGREGLMFAAARHGIAHGVIYLELEIRQDLIDTAQKARLVARRMAPAITALAVRRRVREASR